MFRVLLYWREMQDRKEEFPLLDKLIQFNQYKMVENKDF